MFGLGKGDCIIVVTDNLNNLMRYESVQVGKETTTTRKIVARDAGIAGDVLIEK